jgi:hypothetical protein
VKDHGAQRQAGAFAAIVSQQGLKKDTSWNPIFSRLSWLSLIIDHLPLLALAYKM